MCWLRTSSSGRLNFLPSSVTSLTSNIHSLLPRRLYNAPCNTFRHRQIHSPRLASLASLHSSLCSCSFEFPYHLLGHPAPRVCQHVLHSTRDLYPDQTASTLQHRGENQLSLRNLEWEWPRADPDYVCQRQLWHTALQEQWWQLLLGSCRRPQLQEVVRYCRGRHTYRYGRGDSPRILQRRFPEIWDVVKQLAELEKTTSTGVHFKVRYYKEDGHTLWVKIAIN